MSDDYIPQAFKQGNEDQLKDIVGVTNETFGDLGIKVGYTKKTVKKANDVSCQGCGLEIVGQVLEVENKCYHPQCFKCASCAKVIAPVDNQMKFSVVQGAPWCNSCSEARKKDVNNGKVVDGKGAGKGAGAGAGKGAGAKADSGAGKGASPKDSGASAKDKNQEALEKNKSSQEIKSNLEKGKEYCIGCGEAISGMAVQSGDGLFHPDCFKCSVCTKPISNEDGFVRLSGQPAHKECAKNALATKCGSCGKAIDGKFVKAENTKYHPQCFVCSNCKKALAGGYILKDEKPYCESCGKSNVVSKTESTEVISGIRVDPYSGKVTKAEPKAAASAAKKFCGECGKPVAGAFCGNCGHKQ